MKPFSKRFISVVGAAMMVASMSASVFAATTDPNMSVYGQTAFTNKVDVSETQAQRVTLEVVPATEFYYEPTYFDSSSDATAVQWSLVEGSSAGISLAATNGATKIADGQFAAKKVVSIAAGAEPGAASIKAVNPNSSPVGGYINVTVVADGTAAAKTGVEYRFYNGDQHIDTLTGLTVAGDAHNTNANTLYPSAVDGVVVADAASSKIANALIGDPDALGTNVFYSAQVDGVTDALVNYTDSNWNYYGWQYRVYRDLDNDGAKDDIVPLSVEIGAEEFPLQDGDVVVWKYGQYGALTW